MVSFTPRRVSTHPPRRSKAPPPDSASQRTGDPSPVATLPPPPSPSARQTIPPRTSAPSPPITSNPTRAGIAVHSAVNINGAGQRQRDFQRKACPERANVQNRVDRNGIDPVERNEGTVDRSSATTIAPPRGHVSRVDRGPARVTATKSIGSNEWAERCQIRRTIARSLRDDTATAISNRCWPTRSFDEKLDVDFESLSVVADDLAVLAEEYDFLRCLSAALCRVSSCRRRSLAAP